MKISISEIKSQIDHCQSAEAELLKFRAQLKQLRAALIESERAASSDTSNAKSFDKLVDALEAQRREISDLEYRAGLHEKNLTRIQKTLSQQGNAVVDSARSYFNELSNSVITELHRRISPFLAPKQVRFAIPIASVRPLNQPRKLAASMAGHVPKLDTHCAEACGLIVLKYEALLAAGAALETELKLA